MLQPAAIATSRLPALRVVAVWFGRRRMVRQRRVSAARPVDLSRPPTTKAAFSLSPGPVYCSLMWPGLWRLSAALSSPTRSGSAGASPTALCRRSALSKGRRHARRRDDGPGPGRRRIAADLRLCGSVSLRDANTVTHSEPITKILRQCVFVYLRASRLRRAFLASHPARPHPPRPARAVSSPLHPLGRLVRGPCPFQAADESYAPALAAVGSVPWQPSVLPRLRAPAEAVAVQPVLCQPERR